MWTGRAVRELRKRYKLRRTDFARILNLTDAAVFYWESRPEHELNKKTSQVLTKLSDQFAQLDELGLDIVEHIGNIDTGILWDADGFEDDLEAVDGRFSGSSFFQGERILLGRRKKQM